MNQRGAHNPFGGASMSVDKRLGNSFPIVEAVYRQLQHIKYLAENLNELRPKDIELQENVANKTLDWRYIEKDGTKGPWQVLVPLIDITGQSPEMRVSADAHIQWKYTNEPDSAWRNILDLSGYLDQISKNSTDITVLQKSKVTQLASYAELRSFVGTTDQITISDLNIGGVFIRVTGDTTGLTDDGVIYLKSASGVFWKRQFTGYADPCWWGVVMDGDSATPTDNKAALQAAVTYCATRSIPLRMRAGALASSPTIWLNEDANAARLWQFAGMGKHSTRVMLLRGSPEQALFASVSKDGAEQAFAWDNKTIRDFTVQAHPSILNDVVTSMAFDFGICGNFKFEGIRVVSIRNSVARHDMQWNAKFHQIEVWDSGLSFDRKNLPDGATFSITAGSADVVASQAVFDASDVGHTITVRAGGAGLFGRVLSVNSPTQVTLDTKAIDTAVGNGGFGACRVTAPAGATTITVDGSPFKPEHKGLNIVIGQGNVTWWGIFRAKIVAVVNGSTVQLDKPLANAVSNEVISVPVMDFHTYSANVAGGAQSNDIVFDDYWVEESGGVLLCMTDANNIRGTAIKLHGNYPYPKGKITTNNAWFANVDGFMNLMTDAYTVEYAAIRVFPQAGSILKIPMLEGVFFQGTCAVRHEGLDSTDPPGVVVVEDVSCLSTKTDYQWVTNAITEADPFMTPRAYLRGAAIGGNFAPNGFYGRVQELPLYGQDLSGNRVRQTDGWYSYINLGPVAHLIFHYIPQINTAGLVGSDMYTIRMPNDFVVKFNPLGLVDLVVAGVQGPFAFFTLPDRGAIGIKSLSAGRALTCSEMNNVEMGGGSITIYRTQR